MADVRSARRANLPALLDPYAQLNPDDPVPDPDDRREHWEAMLADGHLDILLVDHDERPVATCVLAVDPNLTRNARPFAVIENVVTHEDHRGEGFATQVVRAAVDRADARGCYKVMLLTGTEREWKLEFYEECGFDRDEKTGFVRYLPD